MATIRIEEILVKKLRKESQFVIAFYNINSGYSVIDMFPVSNFDMKLGLQRNYFIFQMGCVIPHGWHQDKMLFTMENVLLSVSDEIDFDELYLDDLKEQKIDETTNNIVWSPDSQKICYLRLDNTICMYNIETQETKEYESDLPIRPVRWR